MEPASPVLADRFFTSEPPGKTPALPVLNMYPREKLRLEEVFYTHFHIYGSITYSNQKMEAVQVSIDE